MDKMTMCRICLVENVRMYIVKDMNLQELYGKLTNIPFVTEDRRPVLACFLCFAKLKQCYQLQRKCLEAEEVFAQMMNEPNPSVNRGQLEYSSGLTVTPVENISIVDVSHIESIAVKEELPAVCERLDDVIEPKVEHLKYELELELLNNSCSDAEDIPAPQPEPNSEYDVPLVEIKMEVVEEEEQEVSRKKRRASDTTRAAVAKKKNLHTRGKNLEDIITENQKKNEESDTKFSQNTQSGSSKLIPKFQKHLTNTTPRVNISVTLDPNCRNNIKKRNVTKHIRIQTGEKPFKCDVCQSCFVRRDHLTNHIRTHTREKPYRCNECHLCFSQKVHLTSHIRMHTGKKPYKCDECQLGFCRKDYLKRHILTHTGEKPYKCGECQLSFVQKDYLTRHIRTHTGEKPYKCEMCQRSFNMKSDLTRHSRIHNDEKPYECEECHLCFRQKAHLIGHIRTHTGEKPYKCEICQRGFTLKSDVTKHKIRVHTGKRPYKCDICQHIFNYKGNLMRHIRVHSGPEGLEDAPGGAMGT